MASVLLIEKEGDGMAYIFPNTTVKFLDNVPLDPEYENTLYFDNPNEQYNYFNNRAFLSLNNNSYTRVTDGVMRIGWVADQYGGSVISELYNCNYLMFRNTNFENRWFYAFVLKVEYVNNNTVDVAFMIDVMQTWHFDYVFNECMIERQHVTNDTPGAHTLPEQLETGPYTGDRPPYMPISGTTPVTGGDFKYTPGLMLTTTFIQDPSDPDQFQYAPGRIISGFGEMGKYFSGVDMETFPITTAGIADLNDFLSHIVGDEAKAAGVLAISMIPLSLVDPQGGDYGYNDILFTRPSSLGTYTPRNKKLLTYPYNFLYVTNNQGNSAEFWWENSNNIGYLTFRVWANYSTNPAILAAPIEYKTPSGGNYDEMLTVTGFPMCAWSYDSYKAWLAQNSGTIAATTGAVFIQWVRAAVTGVNARDIKEENDLFNALRNRTKSSRQVKDEMRAFETHVDSVSTAAIATFYALGQLYDHSRKPPQSAGNSNGNLQYQAGLMTFSFFRKFIKREYAEIIDKYFDMYGYKINTVGIPNRNARRCYTYVKTIGCNVHGSLPADAERQINAIFDNGIRFWKPNATFGNYNPSVNNNTL